MPHNAGERVTQERILVAPQHDLIPSIMLPKATLSILFVFVQFIQIIHKIVATLT